MAIDSDLYEVEGLPAQPGLADGQRGVSPTEPCAVVSGAAAQYLCTVAVDK